MKHTTGLVFRILTTASLLISLPSYATRPSADCPGLYGNQDFKAKNPTASLPFEKYVQPNYRDLDTYGKIFRTNLREKVSKGSLAIDLGGGRGNAFFELAEASECHAVVVNTQAMENLRVPKQGVFDYQQGWAEELLPAYKGKADLITDVWGAFSYSTKKIEILEGIYDALKPGGEAYILYHPYKTPTFVRRNLQEIEIDQWLSDQYPGVFTWGRSRDPDTLSAHFIKIVKPKGRRKLKIPLELIKESVEVTERNALPTLEFREIP